MNYRENDVHIEQMTYRAKYVLFNVYVEQMTVKHMTYRANGNRDSVVAPI